MLLPRPCHESYQGDTHAAYTVPEKFWEDRHDSLGTSTSENYKLRCNASWPLPCTPLTGISDRRAAAAWRDAFDIRPRDWLKQLATALETSESRLYKDLVVARELHRQQGGPVAALRFSWKFVETSLRCPTRRHGSGCSRKRWRAAGTLAELENAIQKAKNQTPHAGGRPMRVPKSADQGLQQLQSLSIKWLKFVEVIWQQGDESLLHRLSAMPASELSPAMLRPWCSKAATSSSRSAPRRWRSRRP